MSDSILPHEAICIILIYRKLQNEVFIPQKITDVIGADDQSDTPTIMAQQELAIAKRKIQAINEDVLNSEGLTVDEADAAIEAGLIDADQKYWWLEDWQKRYRKAESDIKKERIQEFDSPEAFLNSLPYRY